MALATKICTNARLAQRAIERIIDGVVQDTGSMAVEDRSRWFAEAFLSRNLKEGGRPFLKKDLLILRGDENMRCSHTHGIMGGGKE